MGYLGHDAVFQDLAQVPRERLGEIGFRYWFGNIPGSSNGGKFSRGCSSFRSGPTPRQHLPGHIQNQGGYQVISKLPA